MVKVPVFVVFCGYFVWILAERKSSHYCQQKLEEKISLILPAESYRIFYMFRNEEHASIRWQLFFLKYDKEFHQSLSLPLTTKDLF